MKDAQEIELTLRSVPSDPNNAQRCAFDSRSFDRSPMETRTFNPAASNSRWQHSCRSFSRSRNKYLLSFCALSKRARAKRYRVSTYRNRENKIVDRKNRKRYSKVLIRQLKLRFVKSCAQWPRKERNEWTVVNFYYWITLLIILNSTIIAN